MPKKCTKTLPIDMIRHICQKPMHTSCTRRLRLLVAPVARGGQSAAATMVKKKHSSPDSVVATVHEEVFKQRCQAQLQKSKIPEEDEDWVVCGSIVLNKKPQQQHIGCIRGFVQFLLANKGHDDSLVAFYPRTKKGTVTVSDKAASCCLMSRMQKRKERPCWTKRQVSREGEFCKKHFNVCLLRRNI